MLIVVVLAVWGPALAAETTFLVTGITCDLACTARVVEAFEKLPGVESATVDFESRRARVIYQDTVTDPDHLVEGLKEITGGRHWARPLRPDEEKP